MRRLLASTLLVVAAVLGACGSETVDVEGNWLLVGARVPEGTWSPDSDTSGSRYFVRIAEAVDASGNDVGLVAEGTSGCDNFQARVQQDGDDLDFVDFETNKRPSCPESVPDALEGRFLTAIEAVTSAEMDGDRLVLKGQETALTFEKRES